MKASAHQAEQTNTQRQNAVDYGPRAVASDSRNNPSSQVWGALENFIPLKGDSSQKLLPSFTKHTCNKYINYISQKSPFRPWAVFWMTLKASLRNVSTWQPFDIRGWLSSFQISPLSPVPLGRFLKIKMSKCQTMSGTAKQKSSAFFSSFFFSSFFFS